MKSALNLRRKSSSLLLVAKTIFSPPMHGHPPDFNYNLLTTKRSTTCDFFPNAYTFPGGNMCAADKSLDWLELYSKFGFDKEAFTMLDYTKAPAACLQDLPAFLSLRICAIRETFEECGILICRSKKPNCDDRSARWAAFVDGEEIQKWQESIYKDPLKFLQLCEAFEVYPDVWALKTWSNWLTPSSLPQQHDTMFFVAACNQTPAAHADEREVERLEWATPKEYIRRYSLDERWLPPPQVYEIARVGNFVDVEQLAAFANERAAQHGIECFLPIEYDTDRGLCAILPGDELYPSVPNAVDGRLKLPELPDSDVQHRVFLTHSYASCRFRFRNYTPRCGHIPPAPTLII